MNNSKDHNQATRAASQSPQPQEQESFDQWANAVRRQMIDALKRRERISG